LNEMETITISFGSEDEEEDSEMLDITTDSENNHYPTTPKITDSSLKTMVKTNSTKKVSNPNDSKSRKSKKGKISKIKGKTENKDRKNKGR
ncbi:hypothetical protein HK096_000587, partial [Nowakowskiella sp. JEL0078]